jgi:hypothetical protein
MEAIKIPTSKELKTEKAEIAKEKFEAEMQRIWVNVWVNEKFERKTIFDLITNIGVKEKIIYWNYVEKPAPIKIRTSEHPTVIKYVVHDYGLVFNNDAAIKHVSQKVFNYCKDVETIKIRERL